jgi:hypothetical protein
MMLVILGTLKTEAECSSETPVRNNQIAWVRVQKDM